MKNLINKTIKFVQPYYDKKDIMHGWAHIERILKQAFLMADNYESDKNLIQFWAYFHWVIWQDEGKIREFLIIEWTDGHYIEKIIKISWDSQKETLPDTIEWKILHDAHMLEGWKTFIITKSFIAWTSKWQSLEETIRYIKENIFNKFKCILPENQRLYEEKETFAQEFISDLKNNL
jgi:uncharacterized protein